MSTAAPPTASASDQVIMGEGLCAWVVRITRADVMWMRYVLEASEGLGLMSGGADGVVTLVAPLCQKPQIDHLLADLASEIPLTIEQAPD